MTAVAAWTIWGPSDIFPREDDPKGGKFKLVHDYVKPVLTAVLDPETWTREELRRWLAAVSRRFSLIYSVNIFARSLCSIVK